MGPFSKTSRRTRRWQLLSRFARVLTSAGRPLGNWSSESRSIWSSSGSPGPRCTQPGKCNFGPKPICRRLQTRRCLTRAPTLAHKWHISRYEIPAEDDDAFGVALIGAMPGDELLGRVIVSIPNSMKRPGNPRSKVAAYFAATIMPARTPASSRRCSRSWGRQTIFLPTRAGASSSSPPLANLALRHGKGCLVLHTP